MLKVLGEPGAGVTSDSSDSLNVRASVHEREGGLCFNSLFQPGQEVGDDSVKERRRAVDREVTCRNRGRRD